MPERVLSPTLLAFPCPKDLASVLLSEPPRSPYDLNFRVLGIPIRVHPMFWVVALLLGLGGGDNKPALMLLWVGACFVSIIVHELGHALVARAHGREPWITLYGLGGLASYQPGRQTPSERMLITLAGPGAGFLFAALIVAALAATGREIHFEPEMILSMPIYWEPRLTSFNATVLVFDLLYINIFWGLLNLLPILPLDGGQLAREVLNLTSGRDGLRQALWLSIITAGGLAVLAVTRRSDLFIVLFFGYFAYTNYTMLRQLYGPGGGFGSFR